jgi:hypothetical protein
MAPHNRDASLDFLTNTAVDHVSRLPGTSSKVLPIQRDKLTWFCAVSFRRRLCKDSSTLSFRGPKECAVLGSYFWLLELKFGKDFDVQAARGQPNVGLLRRSLVTCQVCYTSSVHSRKAWP